MAALVQPASARAPRQFNYDESAVPAYELPDPLVCADGSRVKDAAGWRTRRRPEILELFREHVYGRAPAAPSELRFELLEEGEPGVEGSAVRRQVRIHLASDVSLDLLVYLPRTTADASPAFLALNFYGNTSVHRDPEILPSRSWMGDNADLGIVDHRATAATRGARAHRWAIEEIVARGYAFCTVHYGDIDPDHDDGFQNGVHGAFDPSGEERPPDAWGSIGAWAFGLSRCLDYLEQDDDVDAERVAVMGHSRLGKTALWAGARDERFALVISNNSGCGGAALSRREFGETVARINEVFPHWFCGNFRAYGPNVNRLPVDQHMLVALIAPRPAYVASATQDRWADPRGEFLSAKHAQPVYELLGASGLPMGEPPSPNVSVQGTLGYHVREGKHDVTELDWAHYLDFADRHLLATPK
ncbi:MAG: acetylxylan esterase [bacterium]|nr:acetylxylan esterase [bacterium]